MPIYVSRRVFVNRQYQICSFTQEKDGSIYCNWPDFPQTRWIIVKDSVDGPVPIDAISPGEGKFTVHGSGMTGFRKHVGKYDNNILFHGNQLVNPDKTQFGLRHLFTAQFPKPSFIPVNSRYLNRPSDYTIQVSDNEPAIFVFFAIPKQKFDLSLDLSFHEDYIIWSENNEPMNFLGCSLIELSTHVIVWIAYRTNNMTWPATTHIFYDNGFKIPIILGKGQKQYAAELRIPIFEVQEHRIHINITAEGFM